MDRMRRLGSELGQTTAEYALLMIAAAAIAGVLIKWATGDDNGLSDFFSAIIQSIMPGSGG